MSLAYSVSFLYVFVTEVIGWEILGDKIRFRDGFRF